MRLFPRFKVRTLLLAVMLVALLAAIIPRLWWRGNYYKALSNVLESGVRFNLRVGLSTNPEDLQYLLADPERTINELVDIIASVEDARRADATRALRVVFGQRKYVALIEKQLPRLIEIACALKDDPDLEAEVALTIDSWIPAVGVDLHGRRKLYDKAKKSSQKLKLPWIKVLLSLGGRDEIELAVELAGELRVDQFNELSQSRFPTYS